MKSSGLSWKTLPAARNGARFFVCVVSSASFPSVSSLSLSRARARARSRSPCLSRAFSLVDTMLSFARTLSLALSLPRSLSGLQRCIPCCIITSIYHFLMVNNRAKRRLVGISKVVIFRYSQKSREINFLVNVTNICKLARTHTCTHPTLELLQAVIIAAICGHSRRARRTRLATAVCWLKSTREPVICSRSLWPALSASRTLPSHPHSLFLYKRMPVAHSLTSVRI